MMRIVNDDYVAQYLRGKFRDLESESTLIVYRLSKGPNGEVMLQRSLPF